MSFRGMLIKAGIDSNGTDIEIFDGSFKVNKANKLYFRDSGIYLHSNADGYLTIEADLGVIINAPVAITGAFGYTGDLTLVGSLDITGPITIDGDPDVSSLVIGTTGTPISLAADTNHAIDVYTTSPDAAGIQLANSFHHTNTVATTGGHWTMWVQNTVGADNAGSGALYVKLDCATYDAPTGGNSALNVEMVLANCTHAGGSYHPFVIDVDASGPALVMHGNAAIPCSFMKLEAYGADVAQWNEKASLFTLSGITANEDHMFEATDIDAPDFTHTLRINIGGVYYYIGLSSSKAFDA